MIKISNRLKSLCKYVFNDDKIIDVGCDHALLDIYLVQSGIINKIYVCDVNPNALQNGIENIEKYELTGNIIPVLGYGIEKINQFDVNTLIISGMGSKNIIDILSSPNLDRIYKLILQSNNNHYELRKFLTSKGLNIFTEEVVEDGKKTYINIVAGRDYHIKTYTEKEYLFGPILIKDDKNLDYFKSLKESYEDIYYKSHNDSLKEKIAYLDEIIEELSKD